jgi:ATP-binding protein involved in chromosome partitioning
VNAGESRVSSITVDQVRERLRAVPFAGGKDVVSLDLIEDIRVSEGALSVTLELPSPRHPAADETAAAIRATLLSLPGCPPAEVVTTWRVREGETRHPHLPGVKNLIVVASGKGGVGKTTVAVNLAVGLSKLGAATGLMDLDIYGPNVPLALGSDDAAQIEGEDALHPAHAHGVALQSKHHFAPAYRPGLLRGEKMHKKVQHLPGAQ